MITPDMNYKFKILKKKNNQFWTKFCEANKEYMNRTQLLLLQILIHSQIS